LLGNIKWLTEEPKKYKLEKKKDKKKKRKR
jgi:hypothetical protein